MFVTIVTDDSEAAVFEPGVRHHRHLLDGVGVDVEVTRHCHLLEEGRLPLALEVDRGDEDKDHGRVDVSRRDDSLDAAMKEFDILQKIDPTNAPAWFYKGKIYHLKGRIEDAKSAYEQALRLDPDYGQAKDGLQEVKNEK